MRAILRLTGLEWGDSVGAEVSGIRRYGNDQYVAYEIEEGAEDGYVCYVYHDPVKTEWGATLVDAEGTVVEVEVEVEDAVNHPSHYTSHPSGIEAIEITRHFCFTVGNAIKYLWRAGLKKVMDLSAIDKEIEDLEKAKWYIEDRIAQLKKMKESN